MATVNLGNIKLNWKGAYNSSTAYIVDDVVSYNGSSYVCIQASTNNLPTNTTYWNQMSAKGTDGTDVGTTLTTQGDILYRDGSGLQRLAKGTAGQVLQINTGATAPEWADSSGGVLQSVIGNNNGYNQSTTSSSLVDVESASGTAWETAITPSSSSSKILVLPAFLIRSNAQNTAEGRYTWNISRKIASGSYSIIYNMYEAGAYDRGGSGVIEHSVHAPTFIDLPNTTSAVTYKFQISSNGQELATGWGGSPTPKSYLTLLELGV